MLSTITCSVVDYLLPVQNQSRTETCSWFTVTKVQTTAADSFTARFCTMDSYILYRSQVMS